MKRTSLLLLALVIALCTQASSIFAATPMNEEIDAVIGTPYKYGGTTTKGFDCSGFTSFIFKKLGIDISRSSTEQAQLGTEVQKADLIPGDLVFFDTNGPNNGEITHVGIYVGNGDIAHASFSRGVVLDKLDSKYYKSRYVTARRVLTEEEYLSFAGQ